LLLLVVLAGDSQIGHVAQFTTFPFGAAIEATYVLGDRDSAGSERSVPRRSGR